MAFSSETKELCSTPQPHWPHESIETNVVTGAGHWGRQVGVPLQKAPIRGQLSSWQNNAMGPPQVLVVRNHFIRSSNLKMKAVI